MTYVWRCPECGTRVETPERDAEPRHLHEAAGHVWIRMRRDYKTEKAGTSLEKLREARK